MIPQRNISLISNTLMSAGGRRIPEAVIDREDRHSHQNSHTFYLRYQGPLPAANDVKVDITIAEVLCFLARQDSFNKASYAALKLNVGF